MDRSKFLFILALFIPVSLFITACGPGGPPTANSSSSSRPGPIDGKRGGALTYRFTTPIKTLNYYQADDEPSVALTLFLLNDKLVAMDHEKQAYVPSLAESYTTAADGKTVDVVLREGLKFSDGNPITTADVEFSLKGAYDERTNSPIFRDALLIGEKEIETKLIDERRMQLILPEKVAAVENYLENLAILPKHVLDADFAAGKLAETWKITADPASVVTSGPFMVDAVRTGESLSLKRNPNYWKKDAAGNQLPYLDTLVIEIVPDPNNTIARLQQGTLDIADRIRTSDFAALKTSQTAAKAVDAGPGLNTDHIWFNLNPAKKSGESLENNPKHKWFSDKRFRKAVAHAIDRRSISTNTLQGLATPIYGFVPAGNKSWLNSDAPKTEYDLERARAILGEAGFTARETNGASELFDREGNRVAFTMIVPAENEPRKLMAAVIQEDLAKLGISVQVAPVDFQGLSERWNTSFDYDAILLGLGLTALDPSSFAGLLPSSGAVHQWRPKQAAPVTEWEARIDELFTSQAQETDPAQRKQIFNEIQVIMAEEMPIVPIVSRHIVSAANERIGNHSPSSILPYSLWNAERLFVKQ
jgi:peptide/nickel transport system substrate-binding protein